METTTTKRVLLADDDRTTIIPLRSALQLWGYEVLTVADGEAAWAALHQPDRPLLAILDWMMPGMDGTEICERLSREPDSKSVYTILLTSRDKAVDRLTGFDAGAHDFITKPFDLTDIKRRVAVAQRIIDAQSTILTQHEQLREYAQQLEQLAERRAQQLLHADRLATLGTLSASMAHEISNPMTMISVSTQTLAMLWQQMKPTVTGAVPDATRALMLDEFEQSMENMQKGLTRMVRLIGNMRSFARKDTENLTACNANDLVAAALDLTQARLRRNITVEKALATPAPVIHVNAQQVEQVLVNLILNAADAMAHCDRQVLRITTSSTPSRATIEVEDTGPGIPDHLMEAIWDPFFTTKSNDQGTGLGLAISKNIIAGHGGGITATNRTGGGAIFRIELQTRASNV